MLPRKVKANLETMGEQIKLARKRRGISLAMMADRAQCSQLTVMRAEQGLPTVSIGVYARILFGLGLADDLLLIAQKDEVGNAITNARIIQKNQRKEDDYNVFD